MVNEVRRAKYEDRGSKVEIVFCQLTTPITLFFSHRVFLSHTEFTEDTETHRYTRVVLRTLYTQHSMFTSFIQYSFEGVVDSSDLHTQLLNRKHTSRTLHDFPLLGSDTSPYATKGSEAAIGLNS